MNSKFYLSALLLVLFSGITNAQRYFDIEFGVTMLRPQSVVKTTGKPGALLNYGVCREFSDRFSVRTGIGLNYTAFDLTAYQIKRLNQFDPNFKFSEIQIKQNCFIFNYDLLFNYSIVIDKLSLIAGGTLGLYPYIKGKLYNEAVYVIKDKVDLNKEFQDIYQSYDFAENPTYDGNSFLFGPKFGMGFCPNARLEIDAIYTMFINTLYDTESPNVGYIVNDLKLSYLQLSLVYKMKPSDALRRF